MMSLLKTHPVSLKEHLTTICDILGIDTTKKSTKAQMQSDIETFLNDEPDLESKVRELAMELISEFKLRKATDTTDTAMEVDSSLTCPPQPTNLSISPVHSVNIPTQSQQQQQQQQQQQNSNKTKDLKRKLFPGCHDDDEIEIKRVKPNIPLEDSIQTFIEAINHDREETKKELKQMRDELKTISETLESEREQRKDEKASQRKMCEEIDNALKHFTTQITWLNNNVSQAYKDEVTKGLEKLDMSFKIGMTRMMSLLPSNTPPRDQTYQLRHLL